MARLLDAPHDLVLRFHGAVLGAHQTEHDHLAFRRKAQRREIAGAFVVIFEEKAVDLHFIEQDVGDRLVTALRDPGAFEIAAAEMHRNDHVAWSIADRIIHEPTIEARQGVGIVAARLGRFADRRIAEIGEIGVVELEIAAATLGEIGDLVAIGGGEIVVEAFQLGVDAVADRLAAAAEMEHRRRGNADLGGLARCAFEEIEISPLDRRGMANLGFDMHGRRPEADFRAVVLAKLGGEFAIGDRDAVEFLKKIDMEKGAAKLAVRDAFEPDALLAPYNLSNAVVLDAPKFIGGKLARKKSLARPGEPARAAKAADINRA